MSRRFIAVIATIVILIVAAVLVVAAFQAPARGTIVGKEYTPADREWEYNKTRKKWEWDNDPEECRLLLRQDNGKHTLTLVDCDRYHEVQVGQYWNGK